MAKSAERAQAVRLRRKGKSYLEIAATLNVSKSSVALWCRDVSLTKEQKELLLKKQIKAGGAGRIRGAEVNRSKKLICIQQSETVGAHIFSALSEREFLAVGAALYWGEGSKTDHLSFCNSDPAMILLMLHWFRTFFGVRDEDFMVRIHIHSLHESRISSVIRHWSRVTGLPQSSFTRISYTHAERAKRYPNHVSHFGLLSIRIRKSTGIKYRVLGLIHGLKNSTLPVSADVAQLVRASHS